MQGMPATSLTALGRPGLHSPRIGLAEGQHEDFKNQYVAEIRLKRESVESFDRYPFSLAAVRPLELQEVHPVVTF
jgi:hypothetical protein